MTERTEETILPISYLTWDMTGIGYGDIQFHIVEFNDDFGPWKKGDKISYLELLLSKGILIEYDDNGNEIKTCKFKLCEAV